MGGARECGWGGRRIERGAGAGHELLPALLGASGGAKLQAAVPGLRVLYVLLGLLLKKLHGPAQHG